MSQRRPSCEHGFSLAREPGFLERPAAARQPSCHSRRTLAMPAESAGIRAISGSGSAVSEALGVHGTGAGVLPFDSPASICSLRAISHGRGECRMARHERTREPSSGSRGWVAEAPGSRTQPSRDQREASDFEDREGHRAPFASIGQMPSWAAVGIIPQRSTEWRRAPDTPSAGIAHGRAATVGVGSRKALRGSVGAAPRFGND